MVHPDPRVRDRGLAGLRAIIAACPGMGTSVVTLCTGTRDPDDMWRRHPANATPEAWRDLLASLAAALAVAEEHGVALAFEPEPANVVASAARGRDLLRDMPHPLLKVVMDPANISLDEDDAERAVGFLRTGGAGRFPRLGCAVPAKGIDKWAKKRSMGHVR